MIPAFGCGWACDGGAKQTTQKWPFYDPFWPFFCQPHKNLSKNWDSDGHFEVLRGSENQLVQKLWDNISSNIHFFHAWKCIISGLVWQSEIWHLQRKPDLIFQNGYVQTPSILNFKGLFMRILQYEIKNCLKVIIKAQGHILFGSIFNASDVIIYYISWLVQV